MTIQRLTCLLAASLALWGNAHAQAHGDAHPPTLVPAATPEAAKPVAAAPPAAPAPTASAAPARPAAPAKPDHSLVLPYHMPHLMRWVGQLGLPDEQKAALGTYAKDVVSPKLSPLLDEAQQLEKDIGRAALGGATPAQLAPRLDRLQAVKRQAVEIHIACINHVRHTLAPDVYARLLKLALGD